MTSELRNFAFLLSVCALITGLAMALLVTNADGKQARTLAALQRFPVHNTDRDEPPIARKMRLLEIAESVDDTDAATWEKVMLLAVFLHESGFSEAVHRGTVLGDKGKACGLGQSWAIECPAATSAQVNEALRHLRSAGRFCARREGFKPGTAAFVGGAVSLYGTGKRCRNPSAQKRVATWRKVMVRF